MTRKRSIYANRFRDARREAERKARTARHQPSGQLTFPGWFEGPAEPPPSPRHGGAGAWLGKSRP